MKGSAETVPVAIASYWTMVWFVFVLFYSLLCKWFRVAFLSLDKVLFAELYQR